MQMVVLAPPARRRTAITEHHTPKPALPSVYDRRFLLEQCRWIRDDLDPKIARNGPDTLHADEVIALDDFFRRLLTSNLGAEDLRFSRLHCTVLRIAGQATRWPKRLIDKADMLTDVWERQHGPLTSLGTALYEPEGRLHGICKPEDVSNDKLITKWLRTPGIKPSPLQARKSGDLGFQPGDWWISPVFAFKDGIIDTGDVEGSITSDAVGAYAILVTGDEESASPTPHAFTYKAKQRDNGRYRLTAATRDSRQPVRILRNHSLRSFWAPKAGVRYDGLHRITGWSIVRDAKTHSLVYHIKFERLPHDVSMDAVLRRPFADEIEDYEEFKRLRQLAREKQEEAAWARMQAAMPAVLVSLDDPNLGGAGGRRLDGRDSVIGELGGL